MKNPLLEEKLDQIVHHPPMRSYLANTGGWLNEDQTLVGFVAAAEDRRYALSDYGIYMELAEFNPETERWEGCLFSIQVADMLQELYAEGQFPHMYEAAPSVAELDWLERKAAGETQRAPHPLRAYRDAAPVEALAKVSITEVSLPPKH